MIFNEGYDGDDADDPFSDLGDQDEFRPVPDDKEQDHRKIMPPLSIDRQSNSSPSLCYAQVAHREYHHTTLTLLKRMGVARASIASRCSINTLGLTLTASLADAPPQAKLFLSPPIIEMADQYPPQTAKESNLKRFRNCLKVFGWVSLASRSNSSPAPVPSVVVPLPPTIDVPSPNPLPPVVFIPPADLITTGLEEAAKLRAKYTHFRILVIGRANAGKTTLLKRVCNTKEDPVYSKVKHSLRLIPHSHHPLHWQINPSLKVPNSVILAHFSNQVLNFDAVARDP